ncbi:MAG: ABC transporter ATP-binding protein [Chloroflexi bacterium]|nr:ABC transporter ATP-binding protein [Chloroflexota bacterium]
MTEIAVRVEGLGKRYRIGQFVGYKTLRESLTNAITSPFHRLRHQPSDTGHEPSSDSRELSAMSHELARHEPSHIWALKDVSFEVKQGEAVGIIGRNGSGKSTLLKILSRITAPTEGSVEIHGRVGSLLEVGTGFHPELTGRENVYLNGAIIGMKKSDIDRKFDEIVAFAEIEAFLDTPVKRYSSGMYVRLAFAVAAHLEPDILIVDEVLAVGDTQFQKKCLGMMEEVGKAGRTVLFVSHNMVAVRALCRKTILLENARVAAIGETSDIVNQYLMDKNVESGGEVSIVPRSGAEVAFTRVWITDAEGTATSHIDVKDQFRIWLEFVVRQPTDGVEISICLRNSSAVNVLFTSLSESYDGKTVAFGTGRYVASVLINGSFLMPDNYLLRVSAHYRGVRDIDLRENVLSFTIVETGSAMAPYGSAGKYWSCVLGGVKWQLGGGEIPESAVSPGLP